MTADRVERRMAVRLSQERLRLVGDDAPQDEEDEVASLPSVRRLAALSTPRDGGVESPGGTDLHVVGAAGDDLGGDDDEDEECEADFPGDEAVIPVGEDDYYSDVWESR